LSRWTYDKGSRPEGVVTFDDGTKIHSFHDTDPAHGQNNAFDLVRLHMFGHLDTDQSLPITEQPSYKAMCDFAYKRPEIQSYRANEEFDDVTPTVVPNGTDWMELSAEPENTSEKSRFMILSASEFASAKPPPYLIKGVLPKAELGVIFGESTVGKSFIALDMACSITRGVLWRERRVRQGRAVYVCAEGADGFRVRMSAYARAHGCSLDELPGVIADVPDLRDSADAAALAKTLVDYGPLDLVIIDTLAAASPGSDENTGKDMGLILSHCKFFHRQTGALVVLIHHSGKDPSKGARGWSGLKAAADVELEVVRNGDYRSITTSKLKDGSDGLEWGFILKPVVLGFDDDDEEITSCIIEHVDVPVDIGPHKITPQGAKKKMVYRVARDMLAGQPTIESFDLMTECVKTLAQPAGGRDTRENYVIKAIQELTAEGFLYACGDRQEKLALSRALLDEDESSWLD